MRRLPLVALAFVAQVETMPFDEVLDKFFGRALHITTRQRRADLEKTTLLKQPGVESDNEHTNAHVAGGAHPRSARHSTHVVTAVQDLPNGGRLLTMANGVKLHALPNGWKLVYFPDGRVEEMEPSVGQGDAPADTIADTMANTMADLLNQRDFHAQTPAAPGPGDSHAAPGWFPRPTDVPPQARAEDRQPMLQPGAGPVPAREAQGDVVSSLDGTEGGHMELPGSQEKPGSGDALLHLQRFGLGERRMIFELLLLVADLLGCRNMVDPVGLTGYLMPRDTVVIRAHTGRWLGIHGEEIVCMQDDRHSAAQFVLETLTQVTPLRHGSNVVLRPVDYWGPAAMSVSLNGKVEMFPCQSEASHLECLFTINVDTGSQDASGSIPSGASVYLHSVVSGKTIDVEGGAVRARTSDRGTLQRLVLEKLPDKAHELKGRLALVDRNYPFRKDEQAWLLRRGVKLSLVDKQSLAKCLSKGQERWELLLAYTKLWETDWRLARRDQSAKAKVTDISNGELFMSALRSFFASALRMTQLESQYIYRLCEAFSQALIDDPIIEEALNVSMLPKRARGDSRDPQTPKDMWLLVAYATLILNTELHSSQVKSRWGGRQRFLGQGRTCGVTWGFMAQIYKNVEKEEL
eukprot:gnl/TRDRNA2_/TRDRNA2_81120_c0_seq1.p1 gnl/TRDRNA2_/TRDRNA2_81120_c0~~gnl/TRDRNA2_/TRDRNA2_81120_c0_seq1.p1  ORF type:complete len:634 (-),score=81.35 gnl/TRDRNA2_/TRDRNA2_81120_c0_seq1:182-2083(-)